MCRSGRVLAEGRGPWTVRKARRPTHSEPLCGHDSLGALPQPEHALSDRPLDQQISRRRALKKAAAVGAAVWVAPAIQSVGMTKAWASVGSWTTDPCYSVDIDINARGAMKCETADYHCLTPEAGVGGCSMITVGADGAGGWIVTVPDGGQIVEGYAQHARSTHKAVGPRCNPGAHTAGNTMHFSPLLDVKGKIVRISDIEVTFCASVQPES